MKKIYALGLALLAGGWLMAQTTYQVTFQVDMTGQTVSANGVHVAGSFQGWSPNSTSMTQITGTDIYEVTATVDSGFVEFKYLNGDSWNEVENVPDICRVEYAGGWNNRWLTVRSDTTLKAVMYAGSAAAGEVAVRLRVDMQNETPAGPGLVTAPGDYQEAAGYPGNWAPSTPVMADPDSNNVYELVLSLPPSDTFAYKFAKDTSWSAGNNESVPSACEVNGNRQMITAIMDTLYNEVCYASCVDCPSAPVSTYSMTINVDLNANCFFDPSNDHVDVAGTMNGWGGGDTLTDSDGDGIYTITLDVDSGEVKYKARVLRNGNTNWEGGGDKIVNLASDTILDVRCFGSDTYGACDPLPGLATVTFRVDVTNQGTLAGDVFVMGDFTEVNWQDGALTMAPVLGSPGVYEIVVNDFCPAVIQYKFGHGTPGDPSAVEETYDFSVDGCGVENGTFPDNRQHIRVDDTDITLQYEFDSCTELTIGIEEENENQIVVRPNPFEQTAIVDLGIDQDYTLNIYDLSGRVVKSYHGVRGQVQIDRYNMENGIYLLVVSNEAGLEKATKFVVK
jgi:hypothetical protein